MHLRRRLRPLLLKPHLLLMHLRRRLIKQLLLMLKLL
jgi:hypothetical protein